MVTPAALLPPTTRSVPQFEQQFFDIIIPCRCLRSIQHREATFFRHPKRGGVVFHDEAVERPRFHLADELLECGRGDALAPQVLPDPVADEPLITRYPAPDVPRHLTLEHDGLEDVA